MTKKRLSDLLREEAQKSPDPEAEAIQEVAPEPLEPDPTLDETEQLYETSDEPSPVNTSATPRAKRTGPTKAELETKMTELREALLEAHGKETSLQQQIADLQSDLQEQKILVQKLQAALEQTNQIKAELEQAKKVILQLSEVGSKTTQAVNTPKKENEGFKSQKLTLTTQEVNTPKKENEGFKQQKLTFKKLPQHSIQPNFPDSKPSNPEKKLSNKDIGWFD